MNKSLTIKHGTKREVYGVFGYLATRPTLCTFHNTHGDNGDFILRHVFHWYPVRSFIKDLIEVVFRVELPYDFLNKAKEPK